MPGPSVFIWVLILLLSAGCSKSGGSGPADDGSGTPHIINNDDNIPPVVEIITPTSGQEFSNGQHISITGKITDAGGLYRGSIRIVNDANGIIVKEQLYEIHGFQLYNFSLSHAVSAAMASNYTITVRFEDHGLNATAASVQVKVNP